ncbi:MAG: hypothetical protein AB9915_03015 [Candidatus Dojkabacteria bacterium]
MNILFGILDKLNGRLTPECDKKLNALSADMSLERRHLDTLDQRDQNRYSKAFQIIDRHFCKDGYNPDNGIPFYNFYISESGKMMACILVTYKKNIPLVINFDPETYVCYNNREKMRNGQVMPILETNILVGCLVEHDNEGEEDLVPFTFSEID